MWETVRFLHLVAMAFFVGGQIMLAAVLMPVLRGSEVEMRTVARRFGLGSGVALAVLIATGVAMASHLSRWSDGTLHAKLAVVALAVGLIAVHVLAPRARWAMGALFVASLAIVALGVALAHG